MKIKIRPDATRKLQNNDWHQMNDWLAGLRDAGARAWRGYGGRRHPAMPVSTARAW